VRQEKVLIHATVPLVFEYEEVLLRHRIAAEWSKRETLTSLGLLVGKARRHKVYYLWRGPAEHPEDAHVLEAAVASGASSLVTFNTGDFMAASDLGIEVMTPGAFLRRIEQN
jgi:predicted nucleic acid-binding protein